MKGHLDFLKRSMQRRMQLLQNGILQELLQNRHFIPRHFYSSEMNTAEKENVSIAVLATK